MIVKISDEAAARLMVVMRDHADHPVTRQCRHHRVSQCVDFRAARIELMAAGRLPGPALECIHQHEEQQ